MNEVINMSKEYEAVIGLEVHVELNTKTKIFCGCSTAFGGSPNINVCPVCSGMPGSLPVLNRAVVDKAISIGLATNCNITRNSKFDRKNYFYPDNPQNYQISQLYYPICRDGKIEIETENGKKFVRIHEMHMEEDAGKLIHNAFTGETYVDFNRSGVPLVEIVSEPDMRSADEVLAYLDKLRLTIQYLGASDCKLNEGSMRVDVNMSLREKGTEKFGTRTETKNLNSFKAIKRCIENEFERQADILDAGDKVVQETRRWDDDKGYSYTMRSKEDAQDYRYFPDPDLVPLIIDDKWLDRIRANQPELRDEKKERYAREYGIPEYDIGLITEYKELADIFEDGVNEGADPKKVSNWIIGETLRLSKDSEKDVTEISFSGKNLALLIKMLDDKKINNTIAKQVFEHIFSENVNPLEYAEKNNLIIKTDTGALAETVKRAIEANPKAVADMKAGKKKAMGAIVGFVMKEMKGKCDPAEVNKLVMAEIAKL